MFIKPPKQQRDGFQLAASTLSTSIVWPVCVSGLWCSDRDPRICLKRWGLGEDVGGVDIAFELVKCKIDKSRDNSDKLCFSWGQSHSKLMLGPPWDGYTIEVKNEAQTSPQSSTTRFRAASPIQIDTSPRVDLKFRGRQAVEKPKSYGLLAITRETFGQSQMLFARVADKTRNFERNVRTSPRREKDKATNHTMHADDAATVKCLSIGVSDLWLILCSQYRRHWFVDSNAAYLALPGRNSRDRPWDNAPGWWSGSQFPLRDNDLFCFSVSKIYINMIVLLWIELLLWPCAKQMIHDKIIWIFEIKFWRYDVIYKNIKSKICNNMISHIFATYIRQWGAYFGQEFRLSFWDRCVLYWS